MDYRSSGCHSLWSHRQMSYRSISSFHFNRSSFFHCRSLSDDGWNARHCRWIGPMRLSQQVADPYLTRLSLKGTFHMRLIKAANLNDCLLILICIFIHIYNDYDLFWHMYSRPMHVFINLDIIAWNIAYTYNGYDIFRYYVCQDNACIIFYLNIMAS